MYQDDDDTLSRLSRHELVALLHHQRAARGEGPPRRSAVDASTDEELRAMARSLRDLPERTPSTPASAASRRRATPRVTPGAGSVARLFCVLVTADDGLRDRARTVVSTRHVPLVVVATPDALARLLDSVVPSHVVIDRRLGDEEAVRALLAGRERSTRVYWATGESDAAAALAGVADDV